MDIGINTDKPGSVRKPFQCTICDKSFPRKAILEDHILNRHVGDKSFQCTNCLETNQAIKSFATRNNLNLHIIRVHGPPRLKCKVCLETFRSSSNFAKHKRSHSHPEINKSKCHICAKELLSNSRLNSHLFHMHKQKVENVIYFTCELCSQEFVSRSAVERHVVRQHVVDKAFECPVCSKTFIDQQTLEKHINGHDLQNEHFCDVCSQGFTHKLSFIKHLGVTHNHFFYCDKCMKSFKNKPMFDAHISDSKQELKCYICQEIINSECNLKIHTDSHVKEIKTETNVSKIEESINPSEGNQIFKPELGEELSSKNFHCELCSKTFDREKYFKAHRKVVHPYAEWKCNLEDCSKTFKTYNRFRLHKMSHFKNEKFVCNVCQKSFHRPDTLQRHKRIHNEEKRIKCEICSKYFARPSALRIHMANNHGGLKPFKCPVVNCGTSWAQKPELDQHLISHQTEKLFKCEMCLTSSRAFKTRRQLNNHQRTVHPDTKKIKALVKLQTNEKHTDAIVFICSSSNCSFETVDEKDVALHYNQHHQLPQVLLFKNSTTSLPFSGVPKKFDPSTTSMILKRYKCGICSKYIKSSSALTNHQNRTHRNASVPFKCPHCSKSFNYKASLGRHIRKTHSNLRRSCNE